MIIGIQNNHRTETMRDYYGNRVAFVSARAPPRPSLNFFFFLVVGLQKKNNKKLKHRRQQCSSLRVEVVPVLGLLSAELRFWLSDILPQKNYRDFQYFFQSLDHFLEMSIMWMIALLIFSSPRYESSSLQTQKNKSKGKFCPGFCLYFTWGFCSERKNLGFIYLRRMERIFPGEKWCRHKDS